MIARSSRLRFDLVSEVSNKVKLIQEAEKRLIEEVLHKYPKTEFVVESKVTPLNVEITVRLQK